MKYRGWLVVWLVCLIWTEKPAKAEDAKDHKIRRLKAQVQSLKEENKKLKKAVAWLKQESVDQEERLRMSEQKRKQQVVKLSEKNRNN